MNKETKNMDLFLAGFFFFFGLIDNPVEKKTKEIMEQSPAEKIKSDLKKVNSDYRKTYIKLRNEVMCIGE